MRPTRYPGATKSGTFTRRGPVCATGCCHHSKSRSPSLRSPRRLVPQRARVFALPFQDTHFHRQWCAAGAWASVRKASGFPAQTASLPPLGSAGRLSLPAEPGGLVRAEALGKAKPFRTAGGRAALGCYLSGTLTRPCRQRGWRRQYPAWNGIIGNCLRKCGYLSEVSTDVEVPEILEKYE